MVETNPLISPELATFLESGLSITVGTRNGELEPTGARAWAVRVHDDRAHLSVFLYEKSVDGVMKNLASHPEIALAIDRPTDSRACQLKGIVVASRAAKPEERAEVERQVDGFLSELETLGIPREMTAGWNFWPCVVVDARITQLFEQTPGPGAGEPMR